MYVVPKWALRSLFNSVADLYHHIDRVNERLGILMSNQETLDAYVSELNTAVSAVSTEIQSLKDQLANQVPTEVPVDFSGLDAAINSLEALEPPVLEPPADETPAEEVLVEEPNV